jgi:uncharacterized protein
VAQPLFKVSVAEIERNDVTLECPIPAEWIDSQLADTEAKSQGKSGRLTAYLAKNGREILVQGKATVDVVMPCARTLDPVPLTLQPEIYLLLTPKAAVPKAAVPRATGPRAALAKPSKSGAGKAAEAQGRRNRAAPAEEDPGDELTERDAARDTFEGDHVVLDDFLREHLVLELPLFPLRSDLRSEDSPAIRPPSAAPAAERPLDPRLAPLAAIADKMRQKKE